MVQLTLEQRKLVIEEMVQHHSPTKTVRKVNIVFGIKVSRKCVRENFFKWNQHATIHNRNKGNSGREKSGRSEENIATIQDAIDENSKISIRKLAFQAHLKKNTVHRILKSDLHLSPFKLQIHQELSAGDKDRRLSFCRKIKTMKNEGEINLNNIIFSDECHIYLKGMPNKQNYRNWSMNKPEHFFEKPLHSPKVTVWCGLSGNKIYGPFFFENSETEEAISINANNYLEMLEQIFAEDIDLECDDWFQQDGATAHTARSCME